MGTRLARPRRTLLEISRKDSVKLVLVWLGRSSRSILRLVIITNTLLTVLQIQSVLKCYEQALHCKNQSGNGLDDETEEASFQAKLESICPHFEELRSLLGSRASFHPSGLHNTGDDLAEDPSYLAMRNRLARALYGDRAVTPGEAETGGNSDSDHSDTSNQARHAVLQTPARNASTDVGPPASQRISRSKKARQRGVGVDEIDKLLEVVRANLDSERALQRQHKERQERQWQWERDQRVKDRIEARQREWTSHKVQLLVLGWSQEMIEDSIGKKPGGDGEDEGLSDGL